MSKLLAVIITLSLLAYSVSAEGGKSGTFSGGSSFGGSRSGGSSFGGGGSSFSKPSSPSPSVRPGSSTPSSRPSSDAHTSPSVRPNSGSTPSSRPSTPEDAHTTPSSRPGTGSNTSPTGPPKVFHSNADQAAVGAKARAESKVTFEASKPPAASYKAPNGKEVRVDPKAPSVEHVRSTMTPEKYQQRTVRIEHHYYDHYGPRYSYYRSQPYIYVGGGYSPLFWYAMLDWDINRRAMWMYQNQAVIDQSLYQQQMAQNAELRARIAALEAQKVQRVSGYVDPEFIGNPDLMYDDGHVDAVMHPTVTQANQPVVVVEEKRSTWPVVLWTLFGVGIAALAVKLIFFTDWDAIRNR